ncbi:MAG: zinc ribbon domain-containing protein [bacterium]|nr:zinc ribbon domain-containing protein [bacterium]
MPIFEYRCAKCDRVFEALARRAGDAAPPCPQCGSGKVARLFSRFGFVSGTVSRASVSGAGCGSCRPSPGSCGTCGAR